MTDHALNLPDLFRLCARHHRALGAFMRARRDAWNDIAVRRTARMGLAVLAAMLRRLIWWLARDMVLPPLPPRTDVPAPPAPLSRSARRLRFRLDETPRRRPRAAPNPCPVPETPALSHALMLERLETLAAAYRARHRLARHLARRIDRQLSPRPALLTPALPPAAHARLPDAFRAMLDFLDATLSAPDTS